MMKPSTKQMAQFGGLVLVVGVVVAVAVLAIVRSKTSPFTDVAEITSPHSVTGGAAPNAPRQADMAIGTAMPPGMESNVPAVGGAHTAERDLEMQALNGMARYTSAMQPDQLSQQYPQFAPDFITASDLLPSDKSRMFEDMFPENGGGSGHLFDQSEFISPSHSIGINTMGQSRRNSNQQLRSDPLNPQIPVSPWNNSTITPDINRRPFEIGMA